MNFTGDAKKDIIAEYIRQLREERGMSQEQLAELVGISVSHLSKVECGMRQIGMRTFVKILDSMDVSEEYIFQITGIQPCKHRGIYQFCNIIKDCSDKEIEMFLNTIGMMKENLRQQQYVTDGKLLNHYH